MSETIQMASADINERDVAVVTEVLRSGRLALGSWGTEFERRMAEYVGVKHAIAVSSGTAALHLIVRAMGLGVGDEVIVPSFTFAASVNALLYEGVTPVFADITTDTFNVDPSDIERRITPRTRAVMVVDVFGHPAPWAELQEIAGRHHLRLIDDCCEALGSTYDGRRLGSFGEAGAFAFYPNKQMTTGEGGMLVTNNDETARVARSLANQGRSAMGAWLEHERCGYNYRMDEMSAALGASQLERLDDFIERRREVARMYDTALAHLPFVRTPVEREGVRTSPFVYVILLAEGMQRDAVMSHLAGQGIPSRGYFAPLHTQAYIEDLFGNLRGTLPVTESIAQRTVALPFHNRLTAAEIQQVAQVLESSPHVV